MKYSVIFLQYDPENRKPWAEENLQRIKDITKDEYELIVIRDVFGYVAAANEGLQRATGDYLFLLNDDLIVNDPLWLSKLASPDTITSYRLVHFYMNGDPMPDGSCWCIPRNVYEKVGLLDPQFSGAYGCDEIDYYYRALEAGFLLGQRDADIVHQEGKTFKEYFGAGKEGMTARNVELFYNKWKDKLSLKP